MSTRDWVMLLDGFLFGAGVASALWIYVGIRKIRR